MASPTHLPPSRGRHRSTLPQVRESSARSSPSCCGSLIVSGSPQPSVNLAASASSAASISTAAASTTSRPSSQKSWLSRSARTW
ncbi:hypothetical protein ACFY05_27420 [Microtetraspora fusca]|uniref:Uncharacterized protein n=1 Tax=Microtetraspora fusca TaxID=1997 RepID=A0ABW6VB83_MICFU